MMIGLGNSIKNMVWTVFKTVALRNAKEMVGSKAWKYQV